MAAILNAITINKKLQTLAQSKRFEAFARNAANLRFVTAKQQMLENYDEDPVIKELKDSSEDPSITESEVVSKGNLTAFLGFYPGEHPEQKLRDFIKANTIMQPKAQIEVLKSKINYSFKIKLPSDTAINQNFPTHWSSRSWVRIIEEGLSNTVQRFIFWSEGFRSKSRSTTGLQTKGKPTNIAELTPTPFLTRIFDIFRDRFQ
jgi:hypothetical protein